MPGEHQENARERKESERTAKRDRRERRERNESEEKAMRERGERKENKKRTNRTKKAKETNRSSLLQDHGRCSRSWACFVELERLLSALSVFSCSGFRVQGGQDRPKIDQNFDHFFDRFSVPFWRPLGAFLGVHLGPLGCPSWPKFGPRQLWRRIFC